MTWDKPKTGLQWLMLFAPASLCVLLTLAGGIIDPKEGDWMGWALVGLFIATVASFVQSIWLARVNKSLGSMVVVAGICFAVLMVINCTVSFAGCALGSTMLPGLNFH